LPLGIQDGAGYESGTAGLQAGDWLVIFTDGLVEAENQKSEDYGEERLLQVLQAGALLMPNELLQQVMGNVDTFVGATPQHDDITCLLLKASSQP
jgi:sigma-B regulation protein RsbU (phosphoserine phosphatase)